MSARHYSRTFATEEDRHNCPFYHKIGACRHGDRCSRQHHKPAFSTTMIIPHMYEAPKGFDGQPDPSIEPFEEFMIEVIDEMKKFGEVQDVVVLQNMGDHLYGNTYIQFADEYQCAEALKHIDKRFFAGRPLTAEFSPVTDFKDARCRQFDEGTCQRHGFCNFMHSFKMTKDIRLEIKQSQRDYRDAHPKRRSRSRSRDSRDFRRSSSEERRRMIASWN